MISELQTRIEAVQQRIHTAARGRPVALLAVSKTFNAEAVRAAYGCGLQAFGENYVQEGIAKIEALADLRSRLNWHFIGPLQSNKTRDVAEHFDWVHTVDRLKIAQRLSDQRPPHLPPLQVCVQVNVDNAPTKSGVAPQIEELLALCHQIAALPRLQLRGLMSIPDPAGGASGHVLPDADAFLSQKFALLRELKTQLNAQGLGLDTLSMGMSADLETAIAQGSTMVRVGSALFGNRP